MKHTIRRMLPRPVRRAAYRIGTFLGDEFREPVAECGGYPSVEGALGYLRDWGYRPARAVDVGAYRGDWTRMFKRVFPAASVLMVEPQANKLPLLEAVCSYYPDVECESVLLGPRDGEVLDFIEMETGSSVLEEQSRFSRNTVYKSAVTLDTLISRRAEGFEAVDFLKLDVQGYEIEILKGAPKVLSSCELVLMEASLIPINRGCPLIHDVIEFMASSGFRLLDFCSQIRRKDTALWQTDLLFISGDSAFIPRPELNSENW